MQRQPRLPTAARTRQREQAHHRAREQVANRSYFSGPSDKGGGRRGEPAAPCGGKGCRGIADHCGRWSRRDGCVSIEGARRREEGCALVACQAKTVGELRGELPRGPPPCSLDLPDRIDRTVGLLR